MQIEAFKRGASIRINGFTVDFHDSFMVGFSLMLIALAVSLFIKEHKKNK